MFSGFVEITYPDGTSARWGINRTTEAEVETLLDDAAERVVGVLGEPDTLLA